MDIRNIIDLNVLQQLQDQFSDATGLAAIAVDANGEYITKGSNFTEFCMKYTRGCPEGLKRCVKCDTECSGTYFCHAGLMDFSADIVVNDEKVGAIIGGQVLPNPPDDDKFRTIAEELGIDPDEYIRAVHKVPVRNEKTIRAAAQLLADMVNRLVNLEYITALNNKKMEVFDTEMGKALQAVHEATDKVRDLERNASIEKILAINASIEAARAGEAGVGFAVVAREIGTLANEADSVYSQVGQLVKKIAESIESVSKVDL